MTAGTWEEDTHADQEVHEEGGFLGKAVLRLTLE